MKPDWYQNDTCIGSNMKLSLVSKRYPNNTNLNITNITTTTTTKREKDAVAAVNFKKLKEKGEENMQAIRERMAELDFKEKFIEKILKDYPPKKIEEKLDLLMERKNIQSPAGWLNAALKNDYRGEKPESQSAPHPHLNPPPQLPFPSPLEGVGQGEGDKILSTKEVRSRFKFLRHELMAMDSP